MIQHRRGLILVAVVTGIVALVVTFPARIAYKWVSSPLLAMNGISGTVWSGKAREFSTNGVYLRNLEWRSHPLKLLAGKLAYSVSGSPVSGFFESDIAIGLNGTTTLTNLSGAIPLQMLEAAAKGADGEVQQMHHNEEQQESAGVHHPPRRRRGPCGGSAFLAAEAR